MAEDQLERAYRDRFTRGERAEDEHTTCSSTLRRPWPPSRRSRPPTSLAWPAPNGRCRAPLLA